MPSGSFSVTESPVKFGTDDGSTRRYEVAIEVDPTDLPMENGTVVGTLPNEHLPHHEVIGAAHSNGGDWYHVKISTNGTITILGRHNPFVPLIAMVPNQDVRTDIIQKLSFWRMENEAHDVSTTAGFSSILGTTAYSDEIDNLLTEDSYWQNYIQFFKAVAGSAKLSRKELAKGRVRALFQAMHVFDHERGQVLDKDARDGVAQSASYPETKKLIVAAQEMNSGSIEHPKLSDDDMVLAVSGGIIELFSIMSPGQETGLTTFLDYNLALFRCLTEGYVSPSMFDAFIGTRGLFPDTTFKEIDSNGLTVVKAPNSFYAVKLKILEKIAYYAAGWAINNSELSTNNELAELRSLCSDPYVHQGMDTSGTLATILSDLGLADSSGHIDPSYEEAGSDNPIDFMEIIGIAHYYGLVKADDYSTAEAAVDAYMAFIGSIISELRTPNITLSHSYIKIGKSIVGALKLKDSYESDSRDLDEIGDLCAILAGTPETADADSVYTGSLKSPILSTKYTIIFTTSGATSS